MMHPNERRIKKYRANGLPSGKVFSQADEKSYRLAWHRADNQLTRSKENDKAK